MCLRERANSREGYKKINRSSEVVTISSWNKAKTEMVMKGELKIKRDHSKAVERVTPCM